MKRRAFLGSLGTIAIAGCSQTNTGKTTTSKDTPSPTVTTSRRTTTSTSTQKAVKDETTATPTTVAETTTETTTVNYLDSVPRDRQFIGEEAVAENYLAAKAWYWTAKHKIRYWNSTNQSLEYLKASNDVFVSYGVKMANLSDSTVEISPMGSFRLVIDGEQYNPLPSLPGQVEWGDLRQFGSEYELNEPDYTGIYGKYIEGGNRDSITLLFDVPLPENYPPLFVSWNPKNLAVEGENTPVYLATDQE